MYLLEHREVSFRRHMLAALGSACGAATLVSFAYCTLLYTAIAGGQLAPTPLATALATSWIPTAAFALTLCGGVFSLARAVLNGRGANVGAIYVFLAVGPAIALAVKPSGMSGEAFDFYGFATGAGVGLAIGGVYWLIAARGS